MTLPKMIGHIDMSLVYLVDGKCAECDNCQARWTLDELQHISNLEERIEAGREIPAGQCPECSSLCYVLRRPAESVQADGVEPTQCPAPKAGGLPVTLHPDSGSDETRTRDNPVDNRVL